MMVIKAKSSFILDWQLRGIAVIWGLCRYSRWVMSLLCQDYYLHISTSGFINALPNGLNVVSNQPGSSLGSPVRSVAEWYLDIQLLFVIRICRLVLRKPWRIQGQTASSPNLCRWDLRGITRILYLSDRNGLKSGWWRTQLSPAVSQLKDSSSVSLYIEYLEVFSTLVYKIRPLELIVKVYPQLSLRRRAFDHTLKERLCKKLGSGA